VRIETMARQDQRARADTGRSRAPVPEGPRWYRSRIRRLGPLFGLVPMIVIGAVAWLALRLGEGRTSGMIGLAGGAIAAPGLLVAGAPFSSSDGYALAVMASVPLWLLLGFVAARRATRSPIATWASYGKELLWLTVAVGVGAGIALGGAALSLGESLVG